MKETILLFIFGLISVCTQVQAKSYYIRISTNTSDWSNITADNVNSFIVDYISGTDISATLNGYLASDSIWLAKGTYTISATVLPKSGMIIRGGFAGTESTIQARNKSDLDGNGLVEPWEFTNATEIIPASGSGIGYYGLNFSATNATVDGLILKNFNITSGSANVVRLFAGATGSVFKNSIVKDNTVSFSTSVTNGAICALTGTIQTCLIQSNLIAVTGGAYSSQGGGLQLTGTTSVAIGCVICGNKLSNVDNTKCKGGGAFINTGAKLINCVIYNNEAQGQGGGIYSNNNTCEILNCTVAKNKSGLTGGGLYINGGIANLNNSIFWGNIRGSSADDIQTAANTANSNYMAYGAIGTGSFSASPLYTKTLTSGTTADNSADGTGTLAPKFLNPTTAVGVPTDGTTTTAMTTANFQLAVGSPNLDYANNAKLNTLSVTTDLLGYNRFSNTTADLGAYEGQFISGAINISSLTDCPTCDLNVKNTGHLTIDASKTLAKVTVEAGAKLSVATGQTLTLTNLTLKSDASGTSTFVPVGTGALTVTGTTAVEQYLATTRNWYVSSPVSNAVAPAGYTYYGRHEPGGTETGWTAVSVGAGLTAGKGYIALPGTTGLPITFTTQSGGSLNNGNVTVPLTYTTLATSGKGYNLIGNPYPSHLTWTKAFVDDVTNAALIEPTIYYRTNAGTANSGVDAAWSFITYNASTDEGTPALVAKGIIPPMQAFWVKAKATGNLILDNKLTRLHQTSNPLKAPALKNTDRQRVRLQVSNGTRTDETLLLFDVNANDGYDVFDSPKFAEANSEVQIYTTIGNERLVMNGMKNMPLNQEIALGFVPGNAASFSLKANEISNLPTDVKVILKDNVTLAETDLTDGLTTYQFTPEVTSTNRFSLIFRAQGVTTSIDNTTKLNAQVFVNAANQITIIAPEKSNYVIYNAMGQLIENGILNYKLQTVNCKLIQGVYVVKVGYYNSTRVIIK